MGTQESDAKSCCDASKRRLWRRPSTWIVCIVVAVPLLFYNSPSSPGGRLYAFLEKAEMRSRLAAATSLAERESAVGPMGVVIRFPDGGWIAIAHVYEFSGLFQYNAAVAHTSDGRWFESTSLQYQSVSSYRYFRDERDKMLKSATEDKHRLFAEEFFQKFRDKCPWLYEAQEQPTASAAEAQLILGGFSRSSP
jgi:hypothetical protein